MNEDLDALDRECRKIMGYENEGSLFHFIPAGFKPTRSIMHAFDVLNKIGYFEIIIQKQSDSYLCELFVTPISTGINKFGDTVALSIVKACLAVGK